MKNALLFASSLLTIGSVLPYAIEVIKGSTKPRVVSWFTWSLLTGIACAASLTDKQYPSAILLAAATLATFIIVCLGLRYGDRTFEKFDLVCQAGAIIGVVLWLIFNSPALAIVATIAIDVVGALPTLKHSWQKPHEETAITFLGGCIGALCTVVAATNWQITAIAYPIYLTVMNGAFAMVIVARRKRAVAEQLPELREL